MLITCEEEETEFKFMKIQLQFNSHTLLNWIIPYAQKYSLRIHHKVLFFYWRSVQTEYISNQKNQVSVNQNRRAGPKVLILNHFF